MGLTYHEDSDQKRGSTPFPCNSLDHIRQNEARVDLRVSHQLAITSARVLNRSALKLTLGYVGKMGVVSKATAARPAMVPMHHGTENEAMPPST